VFLPLFTKVQAVCRAEGRDECNRCAVRMTAQGSVTPGMACGSRPVKRIPERGTLPTVGIRQGQGSRGLGLLPPCRRRPLQVDRKLASARRNRTNQSPDSIQWGLGMAQTQGPAAPTPEVPDDKPSPPADWRAGSDTPDPSSGRRGHTIKLWQTGSDRAPAPPDPGCARHPLGR